MKKVLKVIWHFLKGILRKLGVPESCLMAVKPSLKRLLSIVRSRNGHEHIDYKRLVCVEGKETEALCSYERELRLTIKILIECWERE